MTAETWKPVVAYEGAYEVSSLGRVRSLDRIDSAGHRRKGQLLQSSPDKDGYRSHGLCKQGIMKTHFAHALVLEAFIGPCPDGMVACHHPDRSRVNNNIQNLRWDTQKSNSEDREKHGTTAKGDRAGQAKLSAGCIQRIFDLRKAGFTHREIAMWIGVGAVSIHNVLTLKTWRHLQAVKV